jgi:hypothetical protein
MSDPIRDAANPIAGDPGPPQPNSATAPESRRELFTTRQPRPFPDFVILMGTGIFAGAYLTEWKGVSWTTSVAVGLIIVGFVLRVVVANWRWRK